MPVWSNGELLTVSGKHWVVKNVKLHAFTDDNDTLVTLQEQHLYHKKLFHPCKGEIFILEDPVTEKAILIKKFGSRIITSKGAATRNTTEGIQDAVVDLYALSRTHKILGSFYSSFSEIAAQLGSCELQILTL
jgi:hypothetical protein